MKFDCHECPWLTEYTVNDDGLVTDEKARPCGCGESQVLVPPDFREVVSSITLPEMPEPMRKWVERKNKESKKRFEDGLFNLLEGKCFDCGQIDCACELAEDEEGAPGCGCGDPLHAEPPSSNDREITSMSSRPVIHPGSQTYEEINHPNHYTRGIETSKYIRSWGMDFHTGNIIKYVTRAPYKGKYLSDLKKARWYLEKLIEEADAGE